MLPVACPRGGMAKEAGSGPLLSPQARIASGLRRPDQTGRYLSSLYTVGVTYGRT